MDQDIDGERVRDAVRILQEEFGEPDHLELYYFDYDGNEHINFHCPEDVPGVDESADDRYRLERTKLSGKTAWTVDPINIPTELRR